MLRKESTRLYLTSKPSLVSFVFSQLIENESPVNRYSQGTSRPQPPPLFTRFALDDCFTGNVVSHNAISFGTCPMTSKSFIISLGCEYGFKTGASRNLPRRILVEGFVAFCEQLPQHLLGSRFSEYS